MCTSGIPPDLCGWKENLADVDTRRKLHPIVCYIIFLLSSDQLAPGRKLRLNRFLKIFTLARTRKLEQTTVPCGKKFDRPPDILISKAVRFHQF